MRFRSFMGLLDTLAYLGGLAVGWRCEFTELGGSALIARTLAAGRSAFAVWCIFRLYGFSACHRKSPSLFRVESRGAKTGGRPRFSLVFAMAAYLDTR